MFKRILVPVDGSPTSRAGLKLALRLAKEHKARLCLLHVVDETPIAQGEPMSGAAVDAMLESLRRAGRGIIARASAAARAQRVRADAVTVEVIGRRVADMILRQSVRWKADLLVLGTHGRRGLSRLVMGSDAEGVLRESRIPVLLVRGGAARRR